MPGLALAKGLGVWDYSGQAVNPKKGRSKGPGGPRAMSQENILGALLLWGPVWGHGAEGCMGGYGLRKGCTKAQPKDCGLCPEPFRCFQSCEFAEFGGFRRGWKGENLEGSTTHMGH